MDERSDKRELAVACAATAVVTLIGFALTAAGAPGVGVPLIAVAGLVALLLVLRGVLS